MKGSTQNDGDEREIGRRRAAGGHEVFEKGEEQEADLEKMWTREGATESKGERETEIQRGVVWKMRRGKARQLDAPQGRRGQTVSYKHKAFRERDHFSCTV